MKYSRLSIRFIMLFMLLVMSSASFALSADDFIPPVQEDNPAKRTELLAVKDDSSITTSRDSELNADVTAAPSLQDAINKIIARPKVGCQFAGVTGQAASTIVATGMGTYKPDYDNVMASRIEQRNAYVIAFMRAKEEMARTLSGISFEGFTRLEQSNQSETDSSQTLKNLSTNISEHQRQWAQAVLKGYVTYAVQDDGKGRVYVTLVSSPKTRGQLSRTGTDGITAGNLHDGLNALIAEIKSGLVPPVGGRIIDVPATGEVAFVGFGSSIVRHDSEPDVQAELELQAERIAELRAVDGLAGIILGDNTRWEGHVDEDTRKQVKDFETFQRTDPTTGATTTEINAFETKKREMRNSLTNSEVVTSLKRGTLPPGIMRETDIDDDNYFAYGIAVYLPSISNKAYDLNRQMKNSEIVQPVDPDAPTPKPESPKPDEKLDMKRGPSGVINQNI